MTPRWVVAALLLVNGCGVTHHAQSSQMLSPSSSSAGLPTASASAAPPAAHSRVRLQLGQTLFVPVPAGDVGVVNGPAIILVGHSGGGVVARAVHPGTGSVSVQRGGTCKPGALCPHFRLLVGVVDVTVVRQPPVH